MNFKEYIFKKIINNGMNNLSNKNKIFLIILKKFVDDQARQYYFMIILLNDNSEN